VKDSLLSRTAALLLFASMILKQETIIIRNADSKIPNGSNNFEKWITTNCNIQQNQRVVYSDIQLTADPSCKWEQTNSTKFYAHQTIVTADSWLTSAILLPLAVSGKSERKVDSLPPVGLEYATFRMLAHLSDHSAKSHPNSKLSRSFELLANHTLQ
jgi:hypothetical protein